VAKPDLGKKHVCSSCGARFYDLNAKDVKCPKCGKPVKPSKSIPVSAPKPKPEPEKKVAVEGDDDDVELVTLEAIDDIDIDDDSDDDLDEEDEEDGLIADASDLGEDNDDLSEVFEHIDEDVVDKGE